MSFEKDEKTAVDYDHHKETLVTSDKTLEINDTHSDHGPDSASASETKPLTSEEAGDAALANSPWQYKLVALVTALLFPRKSLDLRQTQKISTHIFFLIVGAHFSQSALSAMKSPIKTVNIIFFELYCCVTICLINIPSV